MAFHIEVDDANWQRLLDALEGPGQATVEALNGVFGALREDIRARIPILTGSLLGSERVDSGHHAEGWEGTITYGGASTGPKNPVIYQNQAIYHAGSFDGLEVFDPEFVEAMFASVEAYK